MDRCKKHSLSIAFQELRIFPELTALENVLLKNRLTNHKKKKKFSPFSKQPAFPTKPTKEPASFPSGSSNASLYPQPLPAVRLYLPGRTHQPPDNDNSAIMSRLLMEEAGKQEQALLSHPSGSTWSSEYDETFRL